MLPSLYLSLFLTTPLSIPQQLLDFSAILTPAHELNPGDHASGTEQQDHKMDQRKVRVLTVHKGPVTFCTLERCVCWRCIKGPVTFCTFPTACLAMVRAHYSHKTEGLIISNAIQQLTMILKAENWEWCSWARNGQKNWEASCWRGINRATLLLSRRIAATFFVTFFFLLARYFTLQCFHATCKTSCCKKCSVTGP